MSYTENEVNVTWVHWEEKTWYVSTCSLNVKARIIPQCFFFSRTWDNNFLGTTLSGHRMQASLGSAVAVSQRSCVEPGIFRISNSMWPRVSQ